MSVCSGGVVELYLPPGGGTDQLLAKASSRDYDYKWVTGGGGGSGTVTSVDLTVPTGLSVSGNPITTSGTLAISYTAGYSIPSDAQQSVWSAKQDALVSGTNIKTVNGTTLLGAGNLAVGDVVGPASSTANTLALFSSGTGKAIDQATGVTFDDSGSPGESAALYLDIIDGTAEGGVSFSAYLSDVSFGLYAADLVAGTDSSRGFSLDPLAAGYEEQISASDATGTLGRNVTATVSTLHDTLTQTTAAGDVTTLETAFLDGSVRIKAENLVDAVGDRNSVIWGSTTFDRFSIDFELDNVAKGKTFDFTRAGEIVLSGDEGTAGQVLTSGGPGAPAVWAAGNQITVSATAPASPTLNQLWLDIS